MYKKHIRISIGVIFLSICLSGCTFIPSRYEAYKTYLYSSPDFNSKLAGHPVGLSIFIENDVVLGSKGYYKDYSLLTGLQRYLISKGFVIVPREKAEIRVTIRDTDPDAGGIATPGFLSLFNSYEYAIFIFEVTFSKDACTFVKHYKAIQRGVYDTGYDIEGMHKSLVALLGHDIHKFSLNEDF